MTVGDGVFSSTILLLLGLAVYQISTRGKWRTVGKLMAALVLAGALVGTGLWRWSVYANRPRAATELNGIRLGMTLIDVSLAKGKADSEQVDTSDPNNIGLTWGFGATNEERTLVIFVGPTKESVHVKIVCQNGSYASLLGLGMYSTESAVIDRLGSPTRTSIKADGLGKVLSFKGYNAAYELTKGQVAEVCITSTGEVTYSLEYLTPTPTPATK